MELFKAAIYALHSLLPESSEPKIEQPSSFTPFARLPIELRYKIWKLAAEQRIVRLHYHDYVPRWLEAEQAFEGYAPDHPETSSYAPSDYAGLPTYSPPTQEEYGLIHRPEMDNRPPPPRHIVVTLCSDSHPCNCLRLLPNAERKRPPQTPNILPLPAVLLVCRESRDATVSGYPLRLNDEYDIRGLPIMKGRAKEVMGAPSFHPLITGARFNPAVDAILVKVNITRHTDIVQLHQFAAIVVQQIPDITKVFVGAYIAMAPFKFWSSRRFTYWENWGKTGWWVPVRFLVQFRDLKEVVILYNASRSEKKSLLPAAWRERTGNQWSDELLKVREQWPKEWDGRMPSLEFRSSASSTAYH